MRGGEKVVLSVPVVLGSVLDLQGVAWSVVLAVQCHAQGGLQHLLGGGQGVVLGV